MKIAGKMCLLIKLATKKEGITMSLENTVLENPQGYQVEG